MQSLLVYNTCGISGRENGDIYVEHIETLLAQEFTGVVAVSGCRLTPRTKDILTNKFGSRVVFNFIEDLLPVNITFNHTVFTCENNFGPFDTHVYIDSGVQLRSLRESVPDYAIIKTLEKLVTDGYVIATGQVDNDTGYDYVGSTAISGDYVVPVGKACNAHLNMYGRKLYETFGRPLSDIFAANCSESVLSFLCAAVGGRWAISGNVVVPHLCGVDGASAGFGGLHSGWDNLFCTKKTMAKIIADPEMWESGMGYEECNGVFFHNRDRYDSQGGCLDHGRLQRFIAANFFLSEAEFSYQNINHQFLTPDVTKP